MNQSPCRLSLKPLKHYVAASLLACSAAAQAVIVDFSDPNDLANNFQTYSNSSGVAVSQGSNDYVTVTGATSGTSPKILIQCHPTGA